MKPLPILLALLFLSCARAPEQRPLGYIINVSRVSYREADRWLIEYALDGKAYQAEVPVLKGQPEEYLDYLHKVGRF